MNLTGYLFCAIVLTGTLAVTWVLFPMAAMSHDELSAVHTPIDAELLEDVSIPDFGDVPVLDMVLHYIDNPPLESAPDSGKIRFQGC